MNNQIKDLEDVGTDEKSKSTKLFEKLRDTEL